MNIRDIRSDLANIATGLGFRAWDYRPDSLNMLPAAVVNSPISMVRLNRQVTQVQIPIEFYVSNAREQDGTRRLDALMSTNTEGSFLDAIDANQQSSWTTIRFESSNGYDLQAMDSGSALYVSMILELTA